MAGKKFRAALPAPIDDRRITSRDWCCPLKNIVKVDNHDQDEGSLSSRPLTLGLIELRSCPCPNHRAQMGRR